ncbi:cytochrome P450 [Longimicrobium sp.]|uniref:cytochrome P450 family protein n=1 Tax=Longimicrobium sp. TaxID=2029185 RepID=UPI002CB4850B|nr:cytochrome P450 [Longimicrobium sp.]HSU14653.1 cytochrome P450 [Longimicrobium sp.]
MPFRIDLASPSFKADPYPAYARLRDEAPCHRVRLGWRRAAWLVSRYADVAALLRDGRFAKDPSRVRGPGGRGGGPWLPPFLRPLTRNMLDLDAPDHTRLRALVQKSFTPRLVDGLRPRIEKLVDELLDAALRDRPGELVRQLALPLPLTIIAELLGVPAEDRARFHAWSSRIVSGTPDIRAIAVLPAVRALFRYLRTLFAARRAEPRDDLVSALVHAEAEGDRLSEDELLGMVFLLLAAGHETTVNLIAGGVLALLQNRTERERLRHDPELARPAVEELIRFTSPVELATERYAREEVEIAGVRVRRGELVLGAIGSANRDSAQFPDPDVLALSREPNRHLGFGIGAHYCLGAPLARLEAQIALPALLTRAPQLRLAVLADTLRWRRHVFLRGLRELPVVF